MAQAQAQPKFASFQQDLPLVGIGLGLRRSMLEATYTNAAHIDWVEIVPENYMGRGGRSWQILEETLNQGFPMITHGVDLSIGSTDPLNPRYLRELQQVFDLIQPPWFSDHLCFSSANGQHANDLIPLPFTKEAVDHVVQKIRTLQRQFNVPFLLENISYYCQFGEAEMSEAQFLSEVLEQSDCGLMLDINNVYVNACNHGYDPVAFLNEIPLERTVQVHVAGHLKKHDFIVDTHGQAVCPEVFDLLALLLQKTPIKGILLERDQNFPDFDELLNELAIIRDLARQHQPQLLASSKRTLSQEMRLE